MKRDIAFVLAAVAAACVTLVLSSSLGESGGVASLPLYVALAFFCSNGGRRPAGEVALLIFGPVFFLYAVLEFSTYFLVVFPFAVGFCYVIAGASGVAAKVVAEWLAKPD